MEGRRARGQSGGYRKVRCGHEIRRSENAQRQSERIRVAGRRGQDGAGDGPRPGRCGNRPAEGGAEPRSGRPRAGRRGTRGLADAADGARFGASPGPTADHVAGPASSGAGRG